MLLRAFLGHDLGGAFFGGCLGHDLTIGPIGPVGPIGPYGEWDLWDLCDVWDLCFSSCKFFVARFNPQLAGPSFGLPLLMNDRGFELQVGAVAQVHDFMSYPRGNQTIGFGAGQTAGERLQLVDLDKASDPRADIPALEQSRAFGKGFISAVQIDG